MEKLKCPHCGHLNLPSAVFCFECGQNLHDFAVAPGIKPNFHSLIETESDHPDSPPPRSLEKVNATRNDRENADLYNAMLTCLRCAAINLPEAAQCATCGAALIVADEVYGLKITGSARSSVGQARNNNEDTVGLWARDGTIVALVADGMGGAAAGEEASRLAKETIQSDFTGAVHGSEGLKELSDAELADKMRFAVDHANRVLLERIEEDRTLRGMGTTVTLAVVRGDRLIIVHVGDSRAYMIAGEHGWISQITDDHSFVEALLASGHITSAQAARHPMRSVLYRALGQTEAMGGADFYARDVRAGDRVILASDGLMRHVTDEEIARVAMLHEDPAEIAQTLIDMTNQRGAEDNVSVVALVISAEEDTLVPLEKLVPIPGEQEPDHATHDDAHKTGEIINPTLRQMHNPGSSTPDSPDNS